MREVNKTYIQSFTRKQSRISVHLTELRGIDCNVKNRYKYPRDYGISIVKKLQITKAEPKGTMITCHDCGAAI